MSPKPVAKWDKNFEFRKYVRKVKLKILEMENYLQKRKSVGQGLRDCNGSKCDSSVARAEISTILNRPIGSFFMFLGTQQVLVKLKLALGLADFFI